MARQCAQIAYRGPDDWGYLVDDDFGFGMRRLSIIDIAGGHQPMTTSDGRYSIVFNGEIYNHLDVRHQLAAGGVEFATHSDTETLLAAFAYWGADVWLKLQGMYGVAIWDRATRTLTLARDPLGIKPLYFTQQEGGLAFASEIRALRVLPNHRFDIDERAVHDFFMFGHVLQPRSIFRQVQSLPPGHLLKIDPKGEAVLTAFWEPRFRTRTDLSEAEWIHETRARVLHTVERHMLADVPVGVFLSGGVDSSAIAAAMARVSSEQFKAFTLGFPGTSIDETQAAARVAEHVGCEHIILPLEPAAAGDLLPEVQASFDEPCAATSAVPHWHLSRLAAQHVKVVLCGEGSDEIFAGYKRQRTAMAAARWSSLFKALRPLTAIVDALPTGSSPKWNYLRQNVTRFLDASRLENNFQRFFAGTQISSPGVRRRIYEPGFLARQDGRLAFARLEQEYFASAQVARLTPLQQFMLADITVHMPSSYLNRLDRASMAHSLEARVPYLSHDFVDWALTMPQDMTLCGKTGKYALRKAIKPWLPQGALGNRKLGFQLPFAEWFRGDLSEFAREAWHESGAREGGYLQPTAVDELFAEHRAGTANHGRILYAIAMFSCWWRQSLTFAQREAAWPGRRRIPCQGEQGARVSSGRNVGATDEGGTHGHSPQLPRRIVQSRCVNQQSVLPAERGHGPGLYGRVRRRRRRGE